MAEENVDAILGIEESTVQESNNSSIPDKAPEGPTQEGQIAASAGLNNAANVCQIFLWIGVFLAIIGGLVYLANIDDAVNSHYRSEEGLAWYAVGSACFVYGIIGAISSYIFSKILLGLSVITEAAESYLSKK